MPGKHPFRFEKGDKVRHATWKGFVGVVESGRVGEIFVIWEKMKVGNSEVSPSAFPSCWEITHIEE